MHKSGALIERLNVDLVAHPRRAAWMAFRRRLKIARIRL
jgi:hypothetical protein